ncbi:MAG: hypothetical protein KDD73_16450 [Anaerolineales bacterium]|nr:hypothetical protein [Anaerolineales bacterium]
MIVILVGCDLSALVPGGSSEKSYFGPWQIVEVARPSDPPLMQPEGDAFALDPEWEVASITLVYKWWGLGKPDLVVRRIERQGEGFMSDGQRVSTELVRELVAAMKGFYTTQFSLVGQRHTDDYPCLTGQSGNRGFHRRT